MKTLKDFSNEELKHGIARCRARLSGIMPMGYMTPDRLKEAIVQYKNELQRRGQTELEFQ